MKVMSPQKVYLAKKRGKTRDLSGELDIDQVVPQSCWGIFVCSGRLQPSKDMET